jgi:hypothetical protein
MEEGVELDGTVQTPTPILERPEKTEEPSQNLKDLHNESGIVALSQALEASKGKCLIVVHPFYSFNGLSKNEESEVLNSPDKGNLKDYLSKLGTLIRKFSGQNIPIIVLQDAETGQMDRDNETIDMAKRKVERHMRELFGIEKNHNMFLVVTENEAPYPLNTQEEENEAFRQAQAQNLPLSDVMKGLSLTFVDKLKKAGLTTAYFAGMNFGGGPDFGNTYREASQNPTGGHFKDAEWKLKDYYQKRKMVGFTDPLHAFEIISPEGCLAGAIRMFAHQDVDNIAVTNATYPEKVPTMSQINKRPGNLFEVKKV